MNIQTLLKNNGLTMYALSKKSGLPKTTVIDICTGKTDINTCKAKTVLQLAQALNCSMEDIMKIDNARYEYKTGLPKDKSYLEKALPNWLQESIDEMKKSWDRIDAGEKDLHWDIYWCNLNADINSAEVDQLISSEQAWHLRNKYLRMEKERI